MEQKRQLSQDARKVATMKLQMKNINYRKCDCLPWLNRTSLPAPPPGQNICRAVSIVGFRNVNIVLTSPNFSLHLLSLNRNDGISFRRHNAPFLPPSPLADVEATTAEEARAIKRRIADFCSRRLPVLLVISVIAAIAISCYLWMLTRAVADS